MTSEQALPAGTSPVGRTETAAPPARILIVEDECIIALDLQRSLKRLGYDVPVPLADSSSLFRSVVETRPDLVIMDIHLGGGSDGIDAAIALLREHDIRSLFLTAYSEPSVRERAKQANPIGYLCKPFEPHELASAIRLALAGIAKVE